MEYLDGRDLGAVLRDEGKLPVESAVDYVLQACEALAEAHSIGIIHRDLKPSNLFVIKRLDGSPAIKLIDFGISKVTMPSADGAEGEMTATAVMMGSPLYMAPEQMASARDVDGRADIWSLGIILHSLLTGSPPFRAPTVMGVYELIVQGAPPVRKQRADVPEGVEAAILRCLQKDRKARFADVGELAAALAPFGPPESRFIADRIKRIVLARSKSGSIPPPADVPVSVVAVTPAPTPSGAGDARPAGDKLSGSPATPDGTPPPLAGSTSGISQASQSSVAADPHATDGPWDQRTRPPSSRRRPVALIAASVAALLVGVPIAYLALRAQSAPAVAPGADPSGTAQATTASASADPATPTVVPVGPAAHPVAEAPSATAATTTAPSATPAASVNVRRPPPPPPGPHPPAKGRSAADLFGTQK
jgi:serine/threonine-protein kinase